MNDEKLGATGCFPDGKIDETDEGELTMGVTNNKRNIIVNFGTPVTWFALPPKEARSFADLIVKHAEMVERTEPDA